MLTSFIEMLSYDFIVRAFFAGLIISICAALIGSSLVLRNRSMIGDGLSHVAFGATAIAIVLGIAPLEFAIPAVIVASILILRISQSSRISSDAAILSTQYAPGDITFPARSDAIHCTSTRTPNSDCAKMPSK